MSMIDLARKPSTSLESKAEMPLQPSYPNMHLNVPSTPDIKLNTEITATVKLKLTGVRTDRYSGKANTCLDFDILGIDLGDGSKKKNSSQEDLAEALAGDQKELDKD